MFRRTIIASVFCFGAVAFGVTPECQAQVSRAQIRSMPIQSRPNRPGHFYGNTVRRLSQPIAPISPAPIRTAPIRTSPAPVVRYSPAPVVRAPITRTVVPAPARVSYYRSPGVQLSAPQSVRPVIYAQSRVSSAYRPSSHIRSSHSSRAYSSHSFFPGWPPVLSVYTP